MRLIKIILFLKSAGVFAQSVNGFIRDDATAAPLSLQTVFELRLRVEFKYFKMKKIFNILLM